MSSKPAEPAANLIIYKPPTKFSELDRPSIVLYGTIEPDPATDWTSKLITHLSDLPIAVLNPRCDAWDSTWKEDISFAPFKEQVDWEMNNGAKADVIVFYFKPGSLTPVSLLELGLYVGQWPQKVVVCCPEGFYKKGNVQIVCGRFGVEFVGGIEELGEAVRGRLVRMLEEGKKSAGLQ